MVIAAEVPTQGFESISVFDAAVRADPDAWALVVEHRRNRRFRRRIGQTFPTRNHASIAHREALATIRLQEQSVSPWSLMHSEDGSPQ